MLSSRVVNCSSLAGKQGLIAHTAVAIGYDVAWRKVEAMLLAAAERTPGLLREPRKDQWFDAPAAAPHVAA
jgi:hypothetical protein